MLHNGILQTHVVNEGIPVNGLQKAYFIPAMNTFQQIEELHTQLCQPEYLPE